jgi:hypothetical protein
MHEAWSKVSTILMKWLLENPYAGRHSSFLERFGVNFWDRIVDDCLIGPYVMVNRLSGIQCPDFHIVLLEP